MMKQVVIIIAMLFTPYLLLGQGGQNGDPVERAYDYFKMTFENEFSSAAAVEDSTELQRKTIATTLPEWFVFPGRYSGYKHVIHGISDPGLDSAMALQQAWLRAMALAVIAEQSSVYTIMDNYHMASGNDHMAGKFNVFTGISAERRISSSNYQMIAQHFTPGGEMIVLLGFLGNDFNDGDEKIMVRVENFDAEHLLQSRPMIIGRYSVEIIYTDSVGHETKATWVRDKSMNAIEFFSYVDTVNVQPFHHKLIYRLPDDVELPSAQVEFPVSFSLAHGLWNACISAVLHHLELRDSYGSLVKNLDERFDEQFQGLTRVIFNGQGSFRIKQAKIIENRLVLEFE